MKYIKEICSCLWNCILINVIIGQECKIQLFIKYKANKCLKQLLKCQK